MPSTDRANSFDAVRLIAAATVIVGHAWPLTGLGPAPEVGGIRIYHLAVYVFFALSGYLVGTSWIRDARPAAFLLRRASRIFPALTLLVAATILVVGPLATTLTPAAYFTSPGTWAYLQNLTLLATYELPGVFTGHPLTVVNGSLWTLGPEFCCYLGVLAVGMATRVIPDRLRPRIAAAAFLALGILFASLSLIPGAVPDQLHRTTEAVTFFAIGAALAQWRIPRFPLWPTVAVLVVWVGGVVLTDVPDIVWAWIALPYLVLALGSRSVAVARRAGRFGDLSYGMYLWGFLVQQLVVQFAPGLPLVVDILVVLFGTAGIALASWHLVEAPALAAGRRRASRSLVG